MFVLGTIWNQLELPHRAPRLTDMRRTVSTILTLCMLSVVSACGPQARPSTSSSPAASVSPVITTTATSAPMGYLEGRASIGPLQPVERVGVPPPTPSPAICTARGLVMFDSQSGAEA